MYNINLITYCLARKVVIDVRALFAVGESFLFVTGAKRFRSFK